MKKVFPFLFFFLLFTSSYAQNYGAKTIFKKYNDAVVVIYACDKYGQPFSQGSGVVLNSQGLIVTNFHVCKGSNNIKIKHEDIYIEDVTILGGSEEDDWMFLKVEAGKFKFIPAGNSDNLEVGQKVYALGSPLGYENSITEGIVNGKRDIASLNGEFLQISASISPGSSGGALITAGGKLIGITTASREDGQSINFAIPINRVLASDIYIANSYDDSKTVTEKKSKKKKSEDITGTEKKTKKAPKKKKKEDEIYSGSDKGEGNAKVPGPGKSSENNPSTSRGTSDYGANLESGNSAFKSKNYRAAIDYYTRCIDAGARSIVPYYGRAVAYTILEMYTPALQDVNYVIKTDPNQADYYILRGYIYDNLEKYYDAIEDYAAALELDNTKIKAVYGMGEAYYNLEEYPEAILCFSAYIAMDSSDPYSYYYRARCVLEGNKRYDSIDECSDLQKAYSLGLDEAKELMTANCR